MSSLFRADGNRSVTASLGLSRVCKDGFADISWINLRRCTWIPAGGVP